jgi:small subunit ribosomal protein S8
MTLSDPVANMLTSIRNANLRSYRTVNFPFSNFSWRICQKLKENNFFSECWVDEKNQKIKVKIKYNNENSNIHQIKKISKPSQHIHWKISQVAKHYHDYGIYFISSSAGLLTQREAWEKKQGGKVIFFIS